MVNDVCIKNTKTIFVTRLGYGRALCGMGDIADKLNFFFFFHLKSGRKYNEGGNESSALDSQCMKDFMIREI